MIRPQYCGRTNAEELYVSATHIQRWLSICDFKYLHLHVDKESKKRKRKEEYAPKPPKLPKEARVTT